MSCHHSYTPLSYPFTLPANTQHDRATARLTYAVDVGDGGLRQVVVDHHLHALEVDAYAVMRITGQITMQEQEPHECTPSAHHVYITTWHSYTKTALDSPLAIRSVQISTQMSPVRKRRITSSRWAALRSACMTSTLMPS
jgi:hypothetical protein